MLLVKLQLLRLYAILLYTSSASTVPIGLFSLSLNAEKPLTDGVVIVCGLGPRM